MEKYFFLIYKEIKGTIDPTEAITLNQWLDASKDNLQIKEDIISSYHLMEHREDTFPIDVEADLKTLQNKLKTLEDISKKASTQKTSVVKINRSKSTSNKSLKTWISIAASLLLLVAAIFSFQYISGSAEAEWLSTVTDSNQKETISLNDGSEVWLNKESELKYMASFDEVERKVILNGEAFFNIKRDTKKPFIVETDAAIITVLGTSFNINTRDNNETRVSVKTGSVLITDKNKSQQIILKAGQAAVLNQQTGTLQESTRDISNDYLWHTDKMGFKKASLREVFTVLEGYFNISIINQNKNLDDCIFSMTYQKPDLESILANLKKIYKVSIVEKSPSNYHITDGICK